jgi:hypothetical protein
VKTTASSSLIPLGLAHSKFHFIRKGSVVERSTIRAFFCGMLLTASSALLNTQELPFKAVNKANLAVLQNEARFIRSI